MKSRLVETACQGVASPHAIGVSSSQFATLLHVFIAISLYSFT